MKRPNNIFIVYILLVVIYALITFITPIDKSLLRQYHLSHFGVRLIDIAVLVPLFAIWGAAFFGYIKLKEYASMIDTNKDGKAVSKIGIGLLFLALWLPVSSVGSSATKYISDYYPSTLAPLTDAHNYLTLLVSLAGFYFISEGARDLSEIAKQRPTRVAIYSMSFFLILIGVIYSRIITTTNNNLNIAYHLSPLYVLITLAVPYIFMWFLGILATYEIYKYHRKVKGLIYSRSWALLAYGLGLLILCSVALQFLTTLSYRLTPLSLTKILGIIYILLAAIGLSYVLIALGAKRLRKIEEV